MNIVCKKNNLLFIVYLLGCFFANSLSATPNNWDCRNWELVIDTTVNYAFLEQFSKEVLPKSEGPCRARILYTLGELYTEQARYDSAEYYFTTSIQFATSIKAWDQLANGLCKQASLEIDRNRLEDAAAILNRVKSLYDKGYAKVSKVSYYSSMASLMDERNDLFSAINYLDSSSLEINPLEKAEVANIFHNKGLYYMRLGNYKAAVEQLLSAIEINQHLEDGELGANYLVLGFTYSKTKQYEASVKALNKALGISKEDKRLALELIISNALTGAYRLVNDKQKELESAEHALSLINQVDDKHEISKAYLERGKVSEQLLKLEEDALNYYLKSYSTVKDFSANSRFSPTKALVQYYIKKKQFVKADMLIDTLRKLTLELNRADYSAQTQQLLSQYYEGINQPNLALAHYKAYHEFNDSIANKEVLKQTSYYEREFDSKQKEIDILQLNKANQKQKEATQAAETLQQRYLYGVLLLGLLFALGAYSAYTFRRQKQALETAHTQLSELNRIKDRIFSIISHDLRGMIVPFQRAGKILGYHIDKGNLDRAKYLSNELGKNANQLSDMLDNLLKWSLDQMNGLQINPEQMNIQEEIGIIAAGYQEIAQLKSTQIQVSGKADQVVLFDKNAFHVIFRNLIGNALKYTENGQIKVDWTTVDNQLKVSVTDSGIGMDKSQIQELFKLGHQESKTGTQGEKGTGLGLHLVHQFVTRLNGKIMVDSKLNQGTAFSLQFPINGLAK